jgi:hypothetical protein
MVAADLSEKKVGIIMEIGLWMYGYRGSKCRHTADCGRLGECGSIVSAMACETSIVQTALLRITRPSSFRMIGQPDRVVHHVRPHGGPG